MRAALVLVIAALPLAAADPPQVVFSRLFATLLDGNVMSVATDGAGDVYIAGLTRIGGIPLVRPLQTAGFVFLTKFDPAGNIVFSTMLGAGAGDMLGGIALDRGGNVYLAGATSSRQFPIVNAMQSQLRGAANAWIMKVDADGRRILYSTYLGGSTSTDIATSIAVDAEGCAYVAGFAASADFPITAGTIGAPVPGPFVAKLAPDGSRLLYSTVVEQDASGSLVKLGVSAIGEAAVLFHGAIEKLNAAASRVVYRYAPRGGPTLSAIAVEPSGFVWAAGYSTGGAPVTDHAVQSRPAGAAYHRSVDGGATWVHGADGLDATIVRQIAADRQGALLAATDRGLFRSQDVGASWTRLLAGRIQRVAVDAGGSVYVAREALSGFARSDDGGAAWTDLSLPGGAPFATALAPDPARPGRLYLGADRVYRTDDAGATWTAGPPLDGSGVLALGVDANRSDVVYAAVSAFWIGGWIAPGFSRGGGIYSSADGGATFALASPATNVASIIADPRSPGRAYAASNSVLETTDFGAHWVPLPSPYVLPNFLPAMSIDDSGALLVLASDGRIFRSNDAGATFSVSSGPLAYGADTIAAAAGVVHVGGSVGANAYVQRIDNSGDLAYATYWGGSINDTVSDVAVDSAGNVYVAGTTWSPDFPQRNSSAAYAGAGDSYVVKFAADGDVVYSTTLGGTGSDQLLGVAAGPAGEVMVTGMTHSQDFPAANAPALILGNGAVFVAALR